MSCVAVKDEVTSEVEEEDEEEKRRIKQRRRKERKALYIKQRNERIRRICAGEDVPGVGEEERRRILEQLEKRKERALLRKKEDRELGRRLLAGEDVPGFGEEEKRRIIEREERRKKRNREHMRKILAENYEELKERRSLREKEKRERIRRVCAGEDVPGVGEEERRRIIEMYERTKKIKRERQRKISEKEKYEKHKEKMALYVREKRERIRRICAGEDVPGVGEEERIKIIQEEEKRKERERLHKRNKSLEKREELNAKAAEYKKKKMKEETAEEREARLAKNRFQYLVRSVQRTRTEEEKERERRVRFFWKQAKMATMTEEEWKEEKRKRSEYMKEWKNKFSEEKRKEYLEKLKGSVKRSLQKFKERDPEGYRKRMNEYQRRRLQRLSEKIGVKNNEVAKYYQKKRYEGMSEEEKRRRLNQMKMYQQKRNLRRKLEGTVDDEEIKRRLDELDKRLREELGIGPPRTMRGIGELRSSYSDFEAVDNDAGCSGEVSTGPVDKQEVSQCLDHPFVNLDATTSYADSQAEQVEQAESYFCDFDEDEGASMPSPPDVTMLNTESPSPHLSQQQLDSVTSSMIPEIAELIFSCEYCEFPPFLTENDLKSHLQDNHLKICWKCPSCKEVMISSKHLSEHFKAVHKKPSMSSTIDTQIPQKGQAKEPAVDVPSIPVNVGEEERIPRKSGESFGRKAEYFCLRCPIKLVNSSKISKFKDWKLLHSHVRNKHKRYYWPCVDCHLLKYSKRSLTVHQILCRKKSEM